MRHFITVDQALRSSCCILRVLMKVSKGSQTEEQFGCMPFQTLAAHGDEEHTPATCL